MIPLYGDYVMSTYHGYKGRVYQIRYLTDRGDKAWMDMQSKPLTETQRQEPFVSILVHDSGAVQVPLSTIRRIPPIPNFKHRDMADWF